MDDPRLVHFHRQYMQQVQNLTYPPAKLLLHQDVQKQLHKHFFDGPLKGPPAYQRKVLKRIIELLERAIPEDNVNEDEISNDLMEHIAYLSTIPQDDPVISASQTQIITYITPEPFDSIDPPRILIEEAPNLLAAGSNVGLRTWEASLHLATYLHARPEIVRGRSVIELGAGTGLVSILCAGLLGAEQVLSTDGLPHVVRSMEANFLRNRLTVLSQHDGNEEPGSRLVAKVLDWADNSPQALEDTIEINDELPDYSLILGADITYSPDVVPELAQLLSVLMREMFPDQKMEALISATVRNERTMNVFREACEQRELVIEHVDFTCPSVKDQRGFFHEQAFPIVIMKIGPQDHR